MNSVIAYVIILLILLLVYFRTTKIKSSTEEYFVLNKTENVLGVSLSFYASGMGLWILTAPAEVAWWGLGYDVIGYAISAATPFLLLYFLGPKIANLVPGGATLPQFINIRYGRKAQIVVSLVAIIYMSAFFGCRVCFYKFSFSINCRRFLV
jgi:Na+/proline symporter